MLNAKWVAKRFKPVLTFTLFLMLIFCFSAKAVLITSQVSGLGGNSYQYDFVVNNSGANAIATGVEEFSVFFNFNTYQNLAVVASPVDWSSYVLQPNFGLSQDGVFGSFFLTSPIGLDESLGGFSVSFDWVSIDSQPNGVDGFEVYDANFNIIASGRTSAPPTSVIPLPQMMSLFSLGLAILLVRRKRH